MTRPPETREDNNKCRQSMGRWPPWNGA